ncbi:hypothetical protein [Xanthocytophaga agilis]|uniref:Uncharacterized protein n=1 Tax=Xanthocytophaga agilis TaxID=3048010 RepID=A0AAE3UFK6_9BACT|nr:hypothetical protein [Xanthocytophaga agilis]MDJ1500673.1 hypothetical protein [Xanthocytophaga agilis]
MPSCFLTSTFGGSNCDFNVAGVNRIAVIGYEKVSGYTATSGGTKITGISITDSSKFNEIFAAEDSAGYTDEYTRQGSNRFMTQTLNFTVSDNTESGLEKAHSLLLGKHIALVERKNGTWRVLGLQNGLQSSAGTDGSGTAAGDEAGKTFTLTSLNKGYSPIIESSLAKSLINSAISL